MDDVIALLDQAIEVARTRGHEVTGWTIQSDDLGYAAWLHVDDELGQTDLFKKVDIQPTMLAAARACLAQAGQLPAQQVEAEG